MRVSPGTTYGKERKKWELERLGIQNLSSSRTWFPSACRGLGTQRKASTTFRKGKSRLPRRASGASPSARGPHLGPAQPAASSLPFTDSVGSPPRQRQRRARLLAGTLLEVRTLFTYSLLTLLPRRGMSGVFPCHLSRDGGRFRGPALNCKEPHPTPRPPRWSSG